MLSMSNFDEAYANKPVNVEPIPCKAPECFVGSYPPVAKAGEEGPFFVNTYLLQPNRKMETVGTVAVRSKDLECKK
jgi:hypothetical protein